MMSNENDAKINAVKHWLRNIVIELNFCPFARREFDGGRIRYFFSETGDIAQILMNLVDECRYLDIHSGTETTLFICPTGVGDFQHFLDLVDIADALLIEQGYEGHYQIAHFHPDYCFDGCDADDAENFTNRSPYPMLHIIREKSLERALALYSNPESIPQNNIQKTRELGREKLDHLLMCCFEHVAD